jgi:hypothetical protein
MVGERSACWFWAVTNCVACLICSTALPGGRTPIRIASNTEFYGRWRQRDTPVLPLVIESGLYAGFRPRD